MYWFCRLLFSEQKQGRLNIVFRFYNQREDFNTWENAATFKTNWWNKRKNQELFPLRKKILLNWYCSRRLAGVFLSQFFIVNIFCMKNVSFSILFFLTIQVSLSAQQNLQGQFRFLIVSVH